MNTTHDIIFEGAYAPVRVRQLYSGEVLITDPVDRRTLAADAKRQSKIQSAIEVAVNMVLGATISFVVTQIVSPLLGIQMPAVSNAALTGVLTASSLARSYVLRRVFNRI